MPAIITHHLFGEDALKDLPAGTIESQEELLAFLLGSQGPDPLLARFSALPRETRPCRELGTAMHDDRVVEALVSMREAVVTLSEDDKRVGRAFVLGFLGHYVLDSTAHPFVYAQQNALVSANAELEGLEDEVHALIEADIDVWMLWGQRGLTVNDTQTSANLAHTERVTRVASALVAHMADEVFDMQIGAHDYGDAVSDYELIYALIDPATSKRSEIVFRIENLVRGKSYLQALAHHVSTSDECPAANLERNRWRDPLTGKPHTDSFADLYYIALEKWPAFAKALLEGDFQTLEELVGEINYNGMSQD